ncbi:hypothetical protein H5392_13975 [Tessaracoccus sp. MC1865]|uniref:hypothetical protein n=1 Tax=Tessaracoccus sp. MC1865 TaxID=2760310 RepID=UPI001602CB67|nr:hypothetical protein [Tessaracoccus sp. MC1865]MBB1484965.1 hypothetical protein [Tessaracoccus sp. MC1865]QTO38688.1 hypothetical protein J7D54_06350 [Tessaracoccus sp. MC1865]
MTRKNEAHWQHFEEMAQAPELRVIGIMPQVPPGDLSADFIDHMEVARNDDYAGRFSFVLLAMMHFFPRCVVYVEADRRKDYRMFRGARPKRDVGGFPPEKLEAYIRATMQGGTVGMFFYFTDPDVWIRLEGRFDMTSSARTRNSMRCSVRWSPPKGSSCIGPTISSNASSPSY